MIHFEKRGGEGSLPGLPPFLASLLIGRGLDTQEKLNTFLDTSLQGLSEPEVLPGMKEAVRLLKMARENALTVAIYGDYDADGVCASAILFQALRAFGLACRVFLPDRHAEGYGLNPGAVEEIAKDFSVLVTVDNGITAVKEVALAREMGLCVIVTDHHRPHEELPAADAIVCPTLPGWPFTGYCGAGVAWQLSRALIGKIKAKKLLDLCAIATFADMVPLTGENRIIAVNGLREIAATENPGLRALLNAAALPGTVSGSDAAFRLAPRINACGRMESAQIALSLLTETDPQKAAELAARTQQLNDLRRETEKRVTDSARDMLKKYDLVNMRAIVLWARGWDTGVVGLCAGKIAQETGYPTVILSQQGGQMVGSARSAGGIDIHEALTGCADLFLRFGGHKQAAGMTLLSENAPAFRQRLSEEVEKQLQGRALMPYQEYDSEIELADITTQTVEWLSMLQPYGTGNPQPRFLVRGAEAQLLRAVGAENRHLKCTFRQQNTARDGIAYFMGDQAGKTGMKMDLLVVPQINEFRGEKKPEMQILAMQNAASLPKYNYLETCALLEDLVLLSGIQKRKNAPVQTPRSVEAYLGRQGSCLIARTRKTALSLVERYPEAEICLYEAKDARAYFSVLLGCHTQSVTAPYQHLILCDGEAVPGEAALWQKKTGATVLPLEKSEALKKEIASLRISKDELRTLLKRTAGREASVEALAAASMLSLSQTLAGLYILRDMQLIAFTAAPFFACPIPFDRQKDNAPEHNRIFKLINAE